MSVAVSARPRIGRKRMAKLMCGGMHAAHVREVL
jgi:hypothetical protein